MSFGRKQLLKERVIYRWLGAGLVSLLLAAVIFFTSLVGLAESPPQSKGSFWQSQAENALQAIATNSADLDYQFMLATAQAMLGQVEESMNTFEVLTGLGADDDYALTIIERYGEKDHYHNDLLAQSYLAFAYYVSKDYPSSVTAFDRVIELDPQNPWPLNYQGFSLYQCGRLDLAVSRLKQSIQLNPNNQYSHMLLGLAYYEQGHFLKALGEFAKSPGVIKQIFR